MCQPILVNDLPQFVDSLLEGEANRCYHQPWDLSRSLERKEELPATCHLLLEHRKDDVMVSDGALVVATLQHGIQVGAPCWFQQPVEREGYTMVQPLIDLCPEGMGLEDWCQDRSGFELGTKG